MAYRLKNYFIDDAVSMRERALTLIMGYTVAAMLSGQLIFMHVGNMLQCLISIGACCAVVTILWFIIHRYRVYNVGSIIFSYFLNMICLPMFFILGGGLYGGMEFLFITGVIITFFILDGVQLLIAAAVDVIWYIMVLSLTYYDADIVQNIPHGIKAYISFVFAFIISALVPCMIFAFQNTVFQWQRDRVKESLKSIELASRTKSRFLANMSHELRTPMNAILGMANLIAGEDHDNVAGEDLSLIRQTASSLLTTINDILTYSKLESDRLQLIPEQYSFKKMMNDVIYNISTEAENKNVDFYADIAPDIPDVLYGDDTKIIQVFQYLLFYAVENTESGRIMMDVKCRRSSEMNSVTIFVRICDTGEGLSHDDLSSIYTSYETYDSRRDSRLKKFGLELTICRGILAKMKGDLQLESIADVGSSASFCFDNFLIENVPIIDITEIASPQVLVFCCSPYSRKRWGKLIGELGITAEFADTPECFESAVMKKSFDYIFIPQGRFESLKGGLDKADEKNVYVITDHMHSMGDFGRCRIVRRPLNSMNAGDILCNRWDRREYESPDAHDTFTAPEARALLVDDNMVNIKVAEALLQKYGIKVTSVNSGEKALKKMTEQGSIRGEQYDIVFLDHIMPQMDGAETLKQIRKCGAGNAASVPIISMTANIGEDIRNEMLQTGFQDYLAKPVKVRYLERILLKFLPQDRIIRAVNSTDENSSGTESEPQISGGFDMSAGIANVGGNEDVYDSILMVYYNEGLVKAEDIASEYSRDGDLKRFVTDVHSMKGSSANIGASEMSDAFRKLEMAGKAGDRESIENKLDCTLKGFASLLAFIKKYLQDKGKFTERMHGDENDDFADDRVLEMPDMDEILDLKNELSGENYEEFARLLASLVSRNFGHRLNEEILGIQASFENGDSVTLKKQLTQLIMSMQ